MSEALSKPEQDEREQLERTIRSTQGAFVACGEALKRIQTKKLYRNTHSTFEAYCLEIWGWKKSRAYQIIEASEVVKKLGPKTSTIVDNEAKAREIAKVSEEKRDDVLKKAKKSGDTSAKGIKKAAKEVKTERLDKTGYPIPDGIITAWEAAEELGALWTGKISSVRSELKESLESPLCAEVNNSTVSDLNNAYTGLKRIIPHAVCASCQGRAKKCTLCGERGFVSKFVWDTIIPEEVKKLREKKK